METKEYERLVSAYLDTIYRVAVNGCKNYVDAEDVVQNTFMKLLEKKNEFDDIKKYGLLEKVYTSSGLVKKTYNKNGFIIYGPAKFRELNIIIYQMVMFF